MATSLSAGLVIYDMLTQSEQVMSIATRVFPVLISEDEDVRLPYVCYNRDRMLHTPVKNGGIGPDTATITIACYAESYTQSIELAEAVRSALEYQTYESAQDGIVMRSCVFADAREYADEENHFIQELTFLIKI